MKGINFISKKNNRYFYGNNSGFIFVENAIPDRYNLDSDITQPPILKEELIKNHLSKFGFKPLILETT